MAAVRNANSNNYVKIYLLSLFECFVLATNVGLTLCKLFYAIVVAVSILASDKLESTIQNGFHGNEFQHLMLATLYVLIVLIAAGNTIIMHSERTKFTFTERPRLIRNFLIFDTFEMCSATMLLVYYRFKSHDDRKWVGDIMGVMLGYDLFEYIIFLLFDTCIRIKLNRTENRAAARQGLLDDENV